MAVRVAESTVFALALTGTSASRLVGASGVPGAAASVQVAVPKPAAHSGLLNTAVSPLGWTDRVILTWLVDGSVQLSLQTCTLKAPVCPRWILEVGGVTATQRSAAGLGLEDEGLGLSEIIFAERAADAGDPCVDEGEFAADEDESDGDELGDVELGDVELEDVEEAELDGDAGELVPDELDGDGEAVWLGDPSELDGAELEGGVDAGALDEAETSDTHGGLELGAEPRTEACATTPCVPTDSKTAPPTRPTATVRTCTKHIKIVLSCLRSPCPALGVTGFRDDQKSLFQYLILISRAASVMPDVGLP